ncbi:MAG: hypothetical protein Q8903_04110 [Bacteroidota bacterium]|nr:hypothetical protein [Bacteroidota bacterium]
MEGRLICANFHRLKTLQQECQPKDKPFRSNRNSKLIENKFEDLVKKNDELS